MTLSKNEELSREIATKKIAEYVKYENNYLIFVDSLLKDRSSIFNRNEFIDAQNLFPDILKAETLSKTFSLVLPDSISNKVKYIRDKADIENGPETFLFFSPLLPTKEKNIFAMQVYTFYTSTEGLAKGDSLRFASREYSLYSVKKGRIQYIKSISAPEDFFNLPFLK